MLRLTPDHETRNGRTFHLADAGGQVVAIYDEPEGLPPVPIPSNGAILSLLASDDARRYGVKVLSQDDYSSPTALADTRERWAAWRDAGRPRHFAPTSLDLAVAELADRASSVVLLEVSLNFGGPPDVSLVFPGGGTIPESDREFYQIGIPPDVSALRAEVEAIMEDPYTARLFVAALDASQREGRLAQAA